MFEPHVSVSLSFDSYNIFRCYIRNTVLSFFFSHVFCWCYIRNVFFTSCKCLNRGRVSCEYVFMFVFFCLEFLDGESNFRSHVHFVCCISNTSFCTSWTCYKQDQGERCYAFPLPYYWSHMECCYICNIGFSTETGML